MTNIRCSQVYAEVMRSGLPKIRATQIYAEIMRAGVPKIRATQLYAEVMRANGTEVTISHAAHQRMSRAARIGIDLLAPADTLGHRPIDANDLSVTHIIRTQFVAGVGGGADDLVIYSANSPYIFRIVDSFAIISTAVGGSTLTLRSATGGAGSTLSSALSTASTGRKREASTSTPTLAAGSSLVWRRSNNGLEGEAFVLVRREAQ